MAPSHRLLKPTSPPAATAAISYIRLCEDWLWRSPSRQVPGTAARRAVARLSMTTRYHNLTQKLTYRNNKSILSIRSHPGRV